MLNRDKAHMTTHELIESHGYIPETHCIWTEDDYCLNVHRVLLPKNWIPSLPSNNGIIDSSVTDDNVTSHNRYTDTRTPVLLNHGLLSSSADWVLLGRHKALAFLLCDNGFDVWLGNARGNTYSKCHRHYSLREDRFWNFSWHEIGYYDLPATIDYILGKTGHSKLYYIGYSQGTTTFFVMGSERPEYNDKIIGMVGLAPIAYLAHQRSPLLKCLVYVYDLMKWGSSICHIYQCFPRNKWWQTRILSSFIRSAPNAMTRGFCNCWFHIVAGFGSNQLEKSMLPLIVGHFPAGASTKQLFHYYQLLISKSFHKFDHGVKLNKALYGSTKPPEYNLSRVKTPVTIFYSDNDFLTHSEDINKLMRKLPNVKEVKKVQYEKFNHIDYLWGRDAKTLLYNSIVKALRNF